MYQCLLQLDKLGADTSPWLSYTKTICNECGMSGLLLQDILNRAWVKKKLWNCD